MRKNWRAEPPDVSILAYADSVRRLMAGRGGSMTDEDVLAAAESVVLADKKLSMLGITQRASVVRSVFCSLREELEILTDLSEDAAVTEIMVNGSENIFIEKSGAVIKSNIAFESSVQLEQIIQRLAAKVGREMNDLNPIVDARLSDGSRINAVHGSIAINGPILTIRKFNKSRMTMDDLIRQGDITAEAADMLKLLVESGYNMFVCGGTSSGKTTFLNVLSDYIPKDERVIVIEDSAELAIRGHENLVRLEAKNANAQGKGAVTIRDLIKASLRMRPDRIIVGEVRGAEVVDMISAMSTGHDGSLSTGHANSPKGMLGRLETMFLSGSGFPMEAVRGQIAEAIDIFVHMARTGDGRRRVMEIAEVAGLKNGQVELNTLFRFQAGQGLLRTDSGLLHREKLELYRSEGLG